MKAYEKSFFLSLIIICVIFCAVNCSTRNNAKNDPRGKAYVGSNTCRNCHKDVYNRFIKSSHLNSSALVTTDNTLGSFELVNNTFNFSKDLKIVMEKRDSGMYQVVYKNNKEVEAHRFDIAFGTKNAQTFLYWKNKQTYELPISYYSSVKSWATSPGFSPHHINFNRFIGTDCFECHSSYIKQQLNASTAGITEELDKNSLVNGIDCERCHGPAINHVNYHEAYPDEKQAKYIVTNNSLSRQQKIDECALCHSGNDKLKQQSRFDFRPGDTLADFFIPGSNKETKNFDVHGNQYQLLKESKCFLGSRVMTCNTCHDPHSNVSNNVIEYSQKCLSCHQNTNHNSRKLYAKGINQLNENCIDCHMPKKASDAITFYLSGSSDKSSYMLRSHKIAVYQKDSAVVRTLIDFFNKNKS